MLTISRTYTLSFVTQILHNGQPSNAAVQVFPHVSEIPTRAYRRLMSVIAFRAVP